MKIFLADLVHSYDPAIGGSYRSGNEAGFVVPYGIGSIAAFAKQSFGDAVDISLYKYPDELLDACDPGTPPDIIGLSNYVWNTHLNFVIGTTLKEQFPNVLIVCGGPSVQAEENGIGDYLSENPFVDLCVLHEGERPFAEIVRTYKTWGKSFIADQRPIDSVGFLSSDGRVIYSDKKTKNGDLGELPSPYLGGYLDAFLSSGFVPMFETNRGCPFTCTYCAWGIAALSKVRKFPMDRIYAELEYVATKAPNAPTWFIADANFGILPRDIEIADRIGTIKKKNPRLKTIVIYESKNTPDRNAQIAKVLRTPARGKGSRADNALIALQTLDELAQAATRRSNIKLGKIEEKVAAFQADGHGVRTDILSGLPGETHDGHMESLRKVFTYNFDQIGIYNVVLLPGTEMATQASRRTHKLYTKYFTRAGYFGEYRGIKSVEAEEVICGNSSISPEDLLRLRILHWAIWFGWNHKFFKPILRYAHEILNKNPADVLYSLIKGRGTSDPVRAFFEDLRREYSAEFFDTADTLREHYLNEIERSGQGGARNRPTHLIHNAKLVKDVALFECMLRDLRNIVTRDADPTDCDELCRLVMIMRIEPQTLYADDVPETLPISLPSHLLPFCFDGVREAAGGHGLILRKSVEDQVTIRSVLKSKLYAEYPLAAICDIMGSSQSPFSYGLEFERSSALAASQADAPRPFAFGS